MSRRKSTLSKIIRTATRMKRKQKNFIERNRKPGETDEMMEARMKRDLEGWLGMMSDRELEDALETKVKEIEAIDDLQSTQVKDEEPVTDTEEEN